MQLPTTTTEYQQLMIRIETFLQKAAVVRGGTLTPEGATELAQLSELVEAYKDSIPLIPIEVPQTIAEMIEFKMYEKKMKQRDMARLLEVPKTNLSEVLRGKRRVSIDLAKTLRTKLKIDADFKLKHT